MTATTADQQKLQLAVAKAAFSATLSVPGEPKAPAQLVAKLQSLLSAVTLQPSQRNVRVTYQPLAAQLIVQECRSWILEHCSSPKQALVRFITAYSATLPSFKECLALVYVINDVLFHATRTLQGTKAFVPSATTRYLPGLIKSTQSAEDARTDKLNKVFKLWMEKAYFSDEELSQIIQNPITEATERSAESKPLEKPVILGRTGDPHWLLPVSCMLEVMEFSNSSKPIAPSSVKAIRLSEKTDPDLIKLVQNFESLLPGMKFKEEEGSEDDEFDAEGWNLKFWKDSQSRGQREREERIRQRALDTIGRMGSIKAGGSSEESKRGRSPERRRSYTRDSESRSRSRSRGPRQRKDRERSYSASPPPSRRRRLNSRSKSRSPSPRTGRSPARASESQQFRPPQQAYPPSAPYSNIAQQPYSHGGQPAYPPVNPANRQPPPVPANSGYYWDDGPPPAPSSWGYYSVQGQAQTGPAPQGIGRYSSGGNYGKRANDGHGRNWR